MTIHNRTHNLTWLHFFSFCFPLVTYIKSKISMLRVGFKAFVDLGEANKNHGVKYLFLIMLTSFVIQYDTKV